MPTEQIELTTEQSAFITEQTGLIEKLNCLEFESAQLNQAYRLWRSRVEQGPAPDWMAAATRITYDALIRLCLEVSSILADVPHAFSARPEAQWEPTRCEGIFAGPSAPAEPSPEPLAMGEPDSSGLTELTSEQTELIEKLNCLEFETAQLNRAYELWRSYIEGGTAAEWMAGAIRVSYDALITFCLEVSTILADGPVTFPAGHVAELEAADCLMSDMVGEESTTAEPSPELLPMTGPDESGPPLRRAKTVRVGDPGPEIPPSSSDAVWEQPGIQPGQQEQEEEADIAPVFSARLLFQLKSAACEVSGVLEEESTIAEPSPELLPMTEPDEFGPPLRRATTSRIGDPGPEIPPSSSNAIWEQPALQQEQGQEESTIAEPSPELMPMTEPDWYEPEMPAAISAASTGETIWEQPVIQQGEPEEAAGAEPEAIDSPATLANWLQGSSTGILFFIPPGALGRIVLATSVAILIAAGGMIGIYKVNARRAASKLAIRSVQNSASQAAAGAVVIPTSNKAAFKFDPDPVVALPGRSFVLNAVLSRGSDIASMAVQIDYDANLLQFMGVSEGGFLVKDGHQVVLGQRNDPSTGVVRISAEESPGSAGISGDGPVFALSFQARKRGMATVSIVPGAHDSQGRRIEMAGTQVSVRVN